MCEANAYFKKAKGEELILKDVATVTSEDGKWVLVNIFGDQRVINGDIVGMNLLEHKIIFEERQAK